MVEVNDKVMYRDNEGVVKTVMDDLLIVTLSDGKDYSLPIDSVTLMPKLALQKRSTPEAIAEFLRPHVKDMGFLNILAKVMGQAGVGELIIRNGVIQTFNATESLEERVTRYKASALAEAERKAREDHERENKQ